MGLQEPSCKILQLSDCAMMYILSHLDATSLFQLSRTCHYFKNIIEDPKLWEYIEAREEPNSTKKVQYVCDRIHDRTTHILMRAESKYDGRVPRETLLGWNQLRNLRVLALENQRIDGKHINLQNFPKSLVELSLKKTHVKNGKLFFQGSYMTFRNLRVLILDECDWLDSNFFISVAKYENLEILSIIKCMRLHLNVIPYLSIAKHACKKLKIIDCRFNTISNEVLTQACKSVMALYFQSMSSYKLDTGLKLMTIPREDNLEQFANQSLMTIQNESLKQFRYMVGHNIEELPESLLYKDPYPDCSCKWNSEVKNKNEADEIKRQWPIDDYIDFNIPPTKFICRKHVKELRKLPKDFKNFFYHNQKKFYPCQADDSNTDDDSDSEGDDRECCMFGVGKSQQMIVLKVREADEQGNLPQPEVINLFEANEVINVNVDVNVNLQLRARSQEPGPSTSGTTPQAPKRKAEDDLEPGPSSSSSGSSGQNPAEGTAEEVGQATRKKPKLLVASASGSSGQNPAEVTAEEVVQATRKKLNVLVTSVSGSSGQNPAEGTAEEVVQATRKILVRASTSASNTGESSGSRPIPLEPQIIHPPPGSVVTVGNRRIRLRDFDEEIPGPSRQRGPAHFLVKVNHGTSDMRRFDHILAHIRHRFGENNPHDVNRSRLRRLSLRGYRGITDEALISIRNLNLELLDVTYTRVTKEGIESFLTLNPNCRVLHPDYCVCKPRIPC